MELALIKLRHIFREKGSKSKKSLFFASQIKGTVSAKVQVPIEHKERALDAATWPPNLRISSWQTKQKPHGKTKWRRKTVCGGDVITAFLLYSRFLLGPSYRRSRIGTAYDDSFPRSWDILTVSVVMLFHAISVMLSHSLSLLSCSFPQTRVLSLPRR